ncbi:MAG: amidohydrolase family protein [Actinomycetota bacterium]|nr:amidohydrolase family protein [Actinomycetota bacterium]
MSDQRYLTERVDDTDAILGDLKIIDGDSHFSEPPDLWTSRAPSKWKDRMPKWDTLNGQTVWTIDGKYWCGMGGNTINKNMEKVLGTLSLPNDEIPDSNWTAQGRLDIMDRQGVWASVLFPNAIGFTSNAVMSIEDVEFRNIVCQIYNDGMLDTQNESQGRLLPQAILPVWDMDLTLKEMTRLHEAGIRGFTISDKPFALGLPDLDQPYFAPLWSRANELGTVLNFHIGSGVVPLGEGQAITDSPVSDIFWQSFGPQRRLAVLATQFYMSNARIITNLIMSNMFDKYPNVKVVSAESGIGWVPFMLEACEYQLDEMVTTKEERSLQQRRPTEYFRSNVYVMSWFERSAMKILDDVGVDNVMVETDIPHPTCLFPNSRDHFADVTRNLDPTVRRKLLQDNAAGVYRVNMPQ